MKNTTRFELTAETSGVSAEDAPSLVPIRQHFDRPREENTAQAVHRELASLVSPALAGQRIAITGSSRGIANLDTVIRECVNALRAVGAQPFVVPGMGSHGGATAEGQTTVLEDINKITESSVGCPIVSSMDVVQVGTTPTQFPVYQDKACFEADGVLVVNRVKPHTGFTECVESGLCKMMVIGLGKQMGASRIHQQALQHGMGRLILDASKIIIEATKPRFIGGLALVENAFKDTAMIRAIKMDDHAQLLDDEGALLQQAYALLPRLPFDQLDALIVDEIGKNISGSGMDSNVIGVKQGLSKPRIDAIYIRGLTAATHGNAIGMGYADIMPRALLEQVDLNATYMNAFTAKRPSVAKMPMLAQTELQAIQILLNFRQAEDPASLRLAWINNTSQLNTLWVSSALIDEVKGNDALEITGESVPMGFDAVGSLLPLEQRVAS